MASSRKKAARKSEKVLFAAGKAVYDRVLELRRRGDYRDVFLVQHKSLDKLEVRPYDSLILWDSRESNCERWDRNIGDAQCLRTFTLKGKKFYEFCFAEGADFGGFFDGHMSYGWSFLRDDFENKIRKLDFFTTGYRRSLLEKSEESADEGAGNDSIGEYQASKKQYLAEVSQNWQGIVESEADPTAKSAGVYDCNKKAI